MAKPEAHLFPNGNALYFDEDGEQIPRFQRYGFAGVHGFINEYPEAPIHWSIWGEATGTMREEAIEYIKTPAEMDL